MKDLKVVSLFSGAGGLDLGFKQAGYNIALAIDYCEKAIKTHSVNQLSDKAIIADIKDIGALGVAKLIAQEIPHGSKIGIIGGPPCQGFSHANTNSHTDDPRNQLATIYMEIVGILCASHDVSFVLMENVKGLTSEKHILTFQELKQNLIGNGFKTYSSELNSVNFGVPQTRKRVFLIGLNNSHEGNFEFPEPNTKIKTVRDVIGELPEPAYYRREITVSDIPHHPNHWTMRPKSKRFKTKDFNNRLSRCFRKVEWDKPSQTIAFGNREIFVHPRGHRRLSIFEAMLLQGFPKYFQLIGNLSSQVTQISNAVPPPVAKAIAKRIKLSIV